ncbi:MAG: hypothetical protein AAF149_19655 [Bacteroidota bacterium]
MELDEIKKSVESSQANYSRNEIEDIFRIRTKKSISKINSKMLWDAVFMLVTVVILVSATFMIGLKNKYLISFEIICMAAFLLIHYRIKYYLLNKLNFELDIKASIHVAVKRLKIYINIYKMIVPSAIAGFYLKIQFDLFTITDWSVFEIAVRFGLFLPLSVLVFVITDRLTKLMYSNQLHELKSLSKDLD